MTFLHHAAGEFLFSWLFPEQHSACSDRPRYLPLVSHPPSTWDDMGNMLQNEASRNEGRSETGPRDAVPPDVKWRGVAMDNFNGKIWSNTFQRFKTGNS